MATGRCRECRSKISDQAATCPRCGAAAPVAVKAKRHVPLWAVAACAVGVVAFFGALSATGSLPTPPPAAAAETSEAAAKRIRTEVERTCVHAVTERLHDPDSAQMPNYILDDGFDVQVGRSNTIVVSFDYRARNGFNALRSAHAVCRFKTVNGEPGEFTIASR